MPTTVSVGQLSLGMQDWAAKRNKAFQYYWPVKGGWEGWIQVDLIAYFISLDSTLEILREQPIYLAAQKRVDLLVNTSLDADYQIPVEIKAESFENRAQFLAGVNADLVKLDQERNATFKNSTSGMLAISFSPESVQKILGITANGQKIFKSIFMGEVACLFAVWKQAGGWQPA